MYWGTSKWSGSQITSAIAVARQFNEIPPTVEQCRYNMLDRRSVEVDLSSQSEFGLGLTSFSPLGYGILSGKYNSGIPEGSRAALRKWPGSKTGSHPKRSAKCVESGVVAAELGLTPAQLAIAWILRRKEVEQCHHRCLPTSNNWMRTSRPGMQSAN